MRVFNQNHLHEDIRLFIREWVKLLSLNKFKEANSLLDVDSERNFNWNTENLKEVFLDYCWHERMPVINNPDQMDLDNEVITFYEYTDGSGYAVEYDIPLDGEWGDLTAKFSLESEDQRVYRVYLDDIHVM
ncbi:DUF7668 domain-containing protein [Chondrinema litorale]|uniref:DUF7668 domain-containing protein n=1 Tax=Chondrinema litorale TaxID=2994555 RepID=UPI002543C779|nr:hypothetical protein [Chondrinema litorale]UZR96783.1 hypothetical protein OQ292_24085 [Chondrinema litorale]